jgi:hypothetical protein
MAEKYVTNLCDGEMVYWSEHYIDDLAKLLRRVYRMGQKDGFSDGLRKSVEVARILREWS